ncbi:tagaturonate reductase [Actinoplanes sp. CA-051413]|uniref:tagaturonate reductase n=1 Tax=Actinoplanes sp. CA-051413 TaxID=3239899 RepID=UPI003D97DF9E
MTQARPELRPLSSAGVARAELPVRILQIGAGNFIRAFVDLMVHRANEAGVLRHGIAILKVTPRSEQVTPRLAEQDGLFHVVLEGAGATEITLVTAVREVVNAYADWDRCRALARGEELRFVVSNTTEAGIVFVDGDDLTASPPASFPAKMTALLHERWLHFGGDPARGLSFLPCELNEDNGSTLRAMVLRHAARASADPGFAQWVAEHCRFYDTIVDRIVPGLPEDEAAELRQSLGYDDRLIVRGESYGHWAIAGDPAIRDEFPLDRAGQPVEFLTDIRPYREKKVRVLNGAHTAMAAVAPLLGCRTVLEATAHPLAGAYVRQLVECEVLPTLPGDRAELSRFAAAILDRFRNPVLRHQLGDIALNAIAKWRTRNLPVVLDAWRAGRAASLSVFALACLLAGYAGALGDLPVRDDDPAVLSRIRDSFPAGDPQSWLAELFPALGWRGTLDQSQVMRLAAETAVPLRALLAGDPAQVLTGLLTPAPVSDWE